MIARAASELTLHTYLKKTGKEEDRNLYLDEASQNAIIAHASSIEVFCKSIVVEFRSKWSTAGYSQLLDSNLNDAYNQFKEEKVTRESIIAHYYSFQNLDTIARVFDLLTDDNFFNNIENIRYQKNTDTLSVLLQCSVIVVLTVIQPTLLDRCRSVLNQQAQI